MPKVPMDYSKCCIYKIEHVDNESLVYVGHTTNFDKRKTKHKSSCYNENVKQYNLKVYQMIRENGGWDMFKMIEVEKYPCNDRREAERRENEVMKELKASMNTNKSFRTEEEITEYKKEKSKEYYEENKEKIQERVKKYSENNKPKIQEKNKEYYETNKPKIQEQKKEHYEENIERIKEQRKKYHEANKAKINEKVKCECGRLVMNRHLKEHRETKTHLEKMK
jgi:hypothetical protein